ncbi:MAG: AMP-binding protein [Akkermansiaceae bacterium]|nr:AMP-binding protein [Akkermansiaceae bacterium]
MNLVALLAERAAEHPDRPALVDSANGVDRIVTYRELMERVAGGASFLKRSGLKRGDTVLLLHPVSIELYEFLLAAFHLGVRAMLADPSGGRAFISLCCQRVRLAAFFGSWKAQAFGMVIPEIRKCPMRFRTGAWFPRTMKWRTDATPHELVDVPEDEPALITFTSGSTGVPKAAVRTHGFLLAQHRALSRSLDFRDGEVDLITLPVFVLANLASGLTSVLAATNLAKPGSPDTAAVLSQCARHAVTRCAASPAFFEAFLRSPDGLPPLRRIYTGGAPVFPDLLRRLRKALPDAEIHSVFGSTEAEPIAHHHPDEEAAALTKEGAGLCSGVPVAEISLRVIRDHWGTPLGPMDAVAFDGLEQTQGQAGEIVVSGDHVLPGYLGGLGDRETKVHVDGTIWHRTGDAGWLDAQGRVWLLGRCAEKLPAFPSSGGLPADAFRYPFAIECALRESFPGIRMATLEWKGERLLVVGKILSAEEHAAISEMATSFGMQRIVNLPELPLDRRHNAKIDYPALRKLLESI